jgi:hypothetical protein
VIKACVLVCDEDRLQKWKLDYELSLVEVQFHSTDKLTNEVPSIEAIHPYDPNMMYLSVDHYLCRIKLNKSRCHKWSRNNMRFYIFSWFL